VGGALPLAEGGVQDMHEAKLPSLIFTDVPDVTGSLVHDGPHYSGARTVRLEFIKNVLRYAALEKISFLVPSDKIQLVTDAISSLGGALNNCEVVNYQQLKASDASSRVVLHSLNANLLRSLEVRQRLQKRTWAVSGLTHDLSDPQIYKDLVLAHASGLRIGDSVFCCSEAARFAMRALIEQAEKLLQQQIKVELPVIPYGIDAELHRRLPKTSARNQLKISNEHFVFLFFGRLSSLTKANLSALIRTFAAGFAASKAFLLLCGEVSGSLDREDLESLRRLIFELSIQKQVRIIENPSSTTKQSLFSAADAFVCPANSMQESFGLTLLEAMIYELPTIVTNWDGYRDIVVDGETGILVPTSYECKFEPCWEEMFSLGEVERQRAFARAVVIDLEALRLGMLRIYRDPGFTRTLGIQGRDRALSVFNWRRIISLHVDHWLRLTNMSAQNEQPVSLRAPSLDYRLSFKNHVGP
jgi:D-inositol-3-phosphate glycosyltransferase